MFAVEDIVDVLARLLSMALNSSGDMAQYEDKYRLFHPRP
jgi:hypothetical protein